MFMSMFYVRVHELLALLSLLYIFFVGWGGGEGVTDVLIIAFFGIINELWVHRYILGDYPDQ
jgi:hypothetical protein